MSQNPPIFLSSCFADPPGTRLRIRDRVQDLVGGLPTAHPRPIWMAEDYPELRPQSHWGDFEKTEFCLEGVRRAECFVAIITERHGSSIAIDGVGQVPTSFFEAELFEAALLGKPSFIFLLDGYEPEGKLSSLLKLLAPAFPYLDLTPRSEDEILKKIDRLVSHFQRPRLLRRILPLPNLNVMVDAQFSFRHRPYDPKSSLPPLRFLEGQLDPTISEPDASHTETILEQAREEENHQVRLTLVWIAVRTLMGAPFHDPKFRNFIPLWERALNAWTSNGGWYGLHGHFPLSCLAALGSVSEIRANFEERDDPMQAIPHGGLASSYYNVAKISGRPTEISKLALMHIQLGIESNLGDVTNQTATRASIFLQLGHEDAALKDYQLVAERRKDQGGLAYGQALSEWGYALVKTGNKQDGVAYMEQGLDLLNASPKSDFRVRAMRKLAEGYARCLKIKAALDLATETHDLAIRIGTYDQIGPLERFAKTLDKFRL